MNIAVLDIGGTSIKSGIYRNGKLEEKRNAYRSTTGRRSCDEKCN